MRPLINSEFGVLEAVVVHTPGREIESVSPSRAAESLYNDVLPMSVVLREHERLVSFLSRVATVFEFRDLLSQAAETHAARRELESILAADIAGGRLAGLTADELVEIAIEGASARPSTLTDFLDERLFSVSPVPNLYFMRDVAMVVGSQVVRGRMAHPIRRRESQLAELAFRHAPPLAGSSLLSWDDPTSGEVPSIEGGDVLVFDEETLLIGISERTTSTAIDELVAKLIPNRGYLTVYAVLLPKTRATIHLDMVFTLVGPETALVHAPVILGPDAVPAVRARYSVSGEPEFQRYDNLVRALEAGGREVETILCGGEDRLRQQREQWLSGTNVFAIGPGKVIAYDCNVATLHSFEAAGFAVKGIDEFLEGPANVADFDRLVISMEGSDLARGGGGPRCMTLPIRRRPVESR